MASIYKDFLFYLSNDLNLDVKIYIDHLDISFIPPVYHGQAEDFVVTVRAIDGGIPLCPLSRATHTPYKKGNAVYWGEWLVLPIKIKDISKTAQLVLELWTVGMQRIGGSTVRFFDSKLRLKRGFQKITVWPELDSSMPITKPKSLGDVLPRAIQVALASSTRVADLKLHCDLITSDPEYHLLKQIESYELNEMDRTPWIDRLTFAQLRKELTAKYKTRKHGRRAKSSDPRASPDADRPASSPVAGVATGIGTALPLQELQPMQLHIHLPAFDYPIIFEETLYPSFITSSGGNSGLPHPPLVVKDASAERARMISRGSFAEIPPTAAAVAATASSNVPYWNDYSSLTMISDPEVDLDNPVEAKYYRTKYRSAMRNVVDPNLKPNRGELARIQDVVASSVLDMRMAADVKELLWKFRYALTINKKALVKFLMAVDWMEEDDAREAVSVLYKWAPIDIEDALRLLSSDFPTRAVREYAVQALRLASNDDLVLFLLQLVQALRYEPDLLESQSQTTGVGLPATAPIAAAAQAYQLGKTYSVSPLADFLIERACSSFDLANFLNWYLVVEMEDVKMGSIFSRVHSEFLSTLGGPSGNPEIATEIVNQVTFLQQLATGIREAVSNKKDSVAARVERLNQMLAPGGAFGELCSLSTPVTAPLNTSIRIAGIAVKGCKIFKSAKYPTAVTFNVHASSTVDWSCKVDPPGLSVDPAVKEAAQAAKQSVSAVRTSTTSATRGTRHGEEEVVSAELATALASAKTTYKVMFKTGDDLRQDQLIIQMILLMDQQLKKVGLDLRLTPYRVLATSTSTGMMELVLHSEEVSAVLRNSDIMAFLRRDHPKESAEYGIDPDIMDTYVKSCAGYCVITYLLGIGDRHLDNIMLTKDGHLFHIDFGYIFGRDPKPLPPPMRLTKEMIDGMGGPESLNYQRFKSYCCQAYNILRKSANLILSLLNLMKDAGIAALAENPDATIAKLQDKFRLDIDDEAADQVFLKLVDESVAALFPAFFEVIHKIRVAMR